MKYINKKSLFETIDNCSEALLYHKQISEKEKNEIATFIINQQGKPNTYANTFAPTETDLNENLILFTGEVISSKVGKCHIIGEEAGRILRKLNVHQPNVDYALQHADQSLEDLILKYKTRYEEGMYCCKNCSCAMWLYVSSGGIFNQSQILKSGIKYLNKHRDGKGRWKGFPYYYVLYILHEMDISISLQELTYSAPYIVKILNKLKSPINKYEERRVIIMKNILSKLNSL